MTNDIQLKIIKPNATLSNFVESFWMLVNNSDNDKDIATLPDGRVDVLFSYSDTEPFNAMLMDLDIHASQIIFSAKTIIFAVSFKLLAVKYILETSIAYQLNNPLQLPDNFWDISINDLNNFENFANKVSEKILNILKGKKVDDKKRRLFEYIYLSNGSMTVKELSAKSFWTSRQINRYFNQYIGISLKEYCTILRFYATLPQIKKGKFFPEQNFADQAHFIKAIKKHSGLTPKELNKNKNDRFVQLLALPKK
ncbi:helix-turn-helix domain-containing protein [Mucilaginibacter arboris]|uniref:AraC family transcriptional regulator n=1 Tax=Mucilaginibacter arboris TaxID=2682090 RepID=A0A7K1T0R0_9SPHI|nr:AraC family transcriptional regulator [Mucilaginibacter arboris]MVN23154.1 AraC family transcriptional regulator [Mucilaginibacter arboris]